MPNAELLRETLEAVRAEAERAADGRWRQQAWVVLSVADDQGLDRASDRQPQALNMCKTAGCFAGHRAFLDGFTHAWRDSVSDALVVVNPTTGETLLTEEMQPVFDGEGAEIQGIWDWAQERLGLSEAQANYLFEGNNSLEQLTGIVEELCHNDKETRA